MLWVASLRPGASARPMMPISWRKVRAASFVAADSYRAKCTATPRYRQKTCRLSPSNSSGPPTSVSTAHPPICASQGSASGMRSPSNFVLFNEFCVASYSGGEALTDGSPAGSPDPSSAPPTKNPAPPASSAVSTTPPIQRRSRLRGGRATGAILRPPDESNGSTAPNVPGTAGPNPASDTGVAAPADGADVPTWGAPGEAARQRSGAELRTPAARESAPTGARQVSPTRAAGLRRPAAEHRKPAVAARRRVPWPPPGSAGSPPRASASAVPHPAQLRRGRRPTARRPRSRRTCTAHPRAPRPTS